MPLKRGLPLLLVCAVSAQAQEPGAQVRRQELEKLQQRIGEVQETLDRTRGHRQEVAADLEGLERRMAALSRGLRTLARDLAEREATLERLQGERTRREESLTGQRDQLARQLRAAHRLGREQRLKLLLSQEDPGMLSRVMAYSGYLSRARAARIADIGARIAELRELETAVARERAERVRLRERQVAERAQLEQARGERRALLSHLERDLVEGGAALRALKQDAEELQRLVARLEALAAKAENAPRQPVSKYKGRLAWPVAGRVAVRFGTRRAGGGLHWDGMVIDAPEGREVRAVYHGRVAFADWLRGFGMLIILDHGEGYMSLYGFNRSLLKETGEWVEEGEPIALVGDSGGRSQPGLYFGVRRRGQAQNPLAWCRALRHGRTG